MYSTLLENRSCRFRHRWSFAVFACALGWLMLFDPWAPFSREVGVCEAGAVRDVLAGNFILPSYDPQARLLSCYQAGMPLDGEWGPSGMVQVPPLYWWLSASATQFLGLYEFALRLPSILAAAAVCALLYAWATVVFDRRIATRTHPYPDAWCRDAGKVTAVDRYDTTQNAALGRKRSDGVRSFWPATKLPLSPAPSLSWTAATPPNRRISPLLPTAR